MDKADIFFFFSPSASVLGDLRRRPRVAVLSLNPLKLGHSSGSRMPILPVYLRRVISQSLDPT